MSKHSEAILDLQQSLMDWQQKYSDFLLDNAIMEEIPPEKMNLVGRAARQVWRAHKNLSKAWIMRS